MAVEEFEAVTEFADWYSDYRINPYDGTLTYSGFKPCAVRKHSMLQYYKREADSRLVNHWKYEKIADAAMVNERTDLPNISSGESAGFIRRIARNTVQHTPNITITSKFEEDGISGVLANYIAKSKIIGDDEYSSSMQQQLYATAVRALAIGFDCVIPSLLQNSMGSWYMQYDTINYRDVFPEPGAKDIRRATDVFVRRYLTKGEVHQLIKTQAVGWDIAALKTLMNEAPVSREYVDYQSKKHSVNSDAYEIMTWYSNSGDSFLTWSENSKMLLRIEKNKHPLKEHPVFFFIPEYDGHQPFGRSVLSLIYGRQEFQDWFFNGAMKLWRLNIEPPIIGYGVVNAIPNIGPGKYTSIPNPNAKIEPFQVNTQSLQMFAGISGQNAANMQQIVGAADQQMAAAGSGGMMSATPQGIEAQQQMVDTTTNNYQKALENFFSKYCSYALTVYFQELKAVRKLTPSAMARKQLLNAGIPAEAFIHEEWEERIENEDGTFEKVQHPADGSKLKDGEMKADFDKLATLYWVHTVPGSLTELEDEKQIRILNQLFVPLSQAMPAIAQAGDPSALSSVIAAMKLIIIKQIELSGSAHGTELTEILNGRGAEAAEKQERADILEQALSGHQSEVAATVELQTQMFTQQQEQIRMLTETQRTIMGHLGVQIPSSAPQDAGAGAPTPAPQ